MKKAKQKIIIAFSVIAFFYLEALVYSLEEDRQEAYEKSMKEAQQLSALNAMEQLRMAVKLYVITNGSYPDILIDDLVNEGILNEEAISLKDKFSINKNDLKITYNKTFDCNFMFKNLNPSIHLKVKNSILHCKNNSLTFSTRELKT